MDAEHRRLLARAVKAEEDAQLLRERLGAAYREIDWVRLRVPSSVHQVDLRARSDRPASSDPLVRLFAAVAPRTKESCR